MIMDLEALENKSRKYMNIDEVTEKVNHPKHYVGKFECIEVMEYVYGKKSVIEFCRCNAFKYLWRAGKKNSEIEDLKKARWYIDRMIKEIENE